MLLRYKTGIIFYMITIIGNIHSYNRINCNKTLDPWNCIYNVYCYGEDYRNQDGNRINDDIGSFRDLKFNRRAVNNDYGDPMYGEENENDEFTAMRIPNRHCKAIQHYYNYGENQFYPLNLVYRRSNLVYQDTPNYLTNSLVTRFDLSNNNYESIPTIHNMENLALLNISNNALTVAELSNIEDFPKLTVLDLSHNIIKNIICDSGHIYRTLKKIDLSFNYLTKIPEAVFDPFNELETLDISHNYIDILSPITFEGMKQLKQLNISYNRISDINSSLFRFVDLVLLDLSNNRIETINSNDFDKLINLVEINLNNNFISVIDTESFSKMQSLKILYLNNNKLDDVNCNLFINLMQLKSVHLAKNLLNNIPKNLFKGKRISEFSIKENLLQGSLENGMFDGLVVDKLDLSNQLLNAVNDYAFNGLTFLDQLLLNNNNISNLAANSFRTLQRLTILDLSSNKIQNIEFEKHDLYNLLSLSLRNNYLTIVKQENFHGFISLQFLDLSDNKITQVESNSFISLKNLINFQISNNPLNGTLKESTFDGFSSLPSLDISCTLLSSIQNGAFVGMVHLVNLNVSHSNINNLEYNIFVHTGTVEILDFSFNKLNDFKINSTELVRLNTLYLNNNFIKILDPGTFENIISLLKLKLSYNIIQNLDFVFAGQANLHILDLSYNPNLNVSFILLNTLKTLDILDLSGIKTNISFNNIKGMSLTYLTIAGSNISDAKNIQVNGLQHLDHLCLSNNNIPKLEFGSFNNISTIRFLDLSYNKITDIDPGIFKDNTMLVSLNISHNFLTTISYGIFRGLIYLSTLDISYNHIKDLQNERFYEINSLSVLIADHNKIETLTAEEFIGTSLTKLSIGANPIPCEVLVNLKRRGVPFEITASNLYENNDENVNGVTCNRKLNMLEQITNFNINKTNFASNVDVLLSIRDIMLNQLNSQQITKSDINMDEKHFINITGQIQQLNADINAKLFMFLNSTTKVTPINNETNILLNKIHNTIANNDTNVLLNKILRVLTLNSATRAPPVQVTKDNATYENLLSYVNKIKQDLEDTFKMDRDKLSDMEAKLDAKMLKLDTNLNNILLSKEAPKHEKLSVSNDSKSLFTETCVALILVILVGFVLFRVYKSGIFVRQRFSVSTRELPGSMDSPL